MFKQKIGRLMVSLQLKKYTLITLCVGKCRKVSEVSEVLEVSEVSEVSEVLPVIDENVRNMTTILKTEENLRIICEEAMSENGLLQVLQALNSLNVFQALQVLSGLFEGLFEEVTGSEVADSDVTV